MADVAVNEYLKEVSSYIEGGGSAKKQIIADLRTAMEEYAAEHPDGTAQELRAAFGDPAAIAAELTSKEEYQALVRAAKRKNKRVVVLCVVLAAVAVLAVAVCFILAKMYGGTIEVSNIY